jgi:hypothetical protein
MAHSPDCLARFAKKEGMPSVRINGKGLLADAAVAAPPAHLNVQRARRRQFPQAKVEIGGALSRMPIPPVHLGYQPPAIGQMDGRGRTDRWSRRPLDPPFWVA